MQKEYIRPLRFASSPWMYGIFLSLSRLGKKFKKTIFETIPLIGTEKVLDIGCGDGTLVFTALEKFPELDITGIDPDDFMIEACKKEAKERNFNTLFIRGYADVLPFEDNSVDGSYITLVLHHMGKEDKRKALQEVHRVLRKGGKLTIADFRKIPMPFIAHFFVFEQYEHLRENFEGLVHILAKEIGFSFISKTERKKSLIEIVTFEKI